MNGRKETKEGHKRELVRILDPDCVRYKALLEYR